VDLVVSLGAMGVSSKTGDTRRMSQRRLSPPIVVGALLYAFFLLASPFEHHDVVCHLKNPFHCTSCTASQLGSDPHPLVVPGSCHFADMGRAITAHVAAGDTLLPVRSTGRSPPLPA
jgi:hypothetical protein